MIPPLRNFRRPLVLTRDRRPLPADYQPVPAWAGQNLLFAVRGNAAATIQETHPVPFPFVIREFVWYQVNGTAAGNYGMDILVSGYGSIWHESNDSPQLTPATINTQPYVLRHDPCVIVPSAGAYLTLKLIVATAGDAYLSCRIQPLEQYLRNG